MKKLLFALFMSAVTGFAADFQLGGAQALKLDYQGKTLIQGERVTFSDASKDWEKHSKVIGASALPGYQMVQNVRLDVPDLSLRREAAVTNDGKVVEIGFVADMPAYSESSNGEFSYDLVLDFEQFKGAKFTAVCGRTSRRTEQSGVIDEKMADGYLTQTPDMAAWFVEFQDGRKLVFDFNVEGVTSYCDFGPNHPQGLWKIRKRGDKLVIFTGRAVSYCGGAILSRMRIYAGTKADWEKTHTRFSYNYFDTLPAERSLTFSPGKSGKEFQSGHKKFRSGDAFGWVDSLPEQIMQGETGALYGAAVGEAGKKHTYRLTGLKDGLGFLTFRFVAYNKASGLFSVKVGGQTVLENKQLAPQTVGDLTVPLRTPDGTLDVEFFGAFQLAVVLYQPLIRIEEDLKVFRGFWIAKELYEPSYLVRSSLYAAVPDFKVDYIETPLAPEKIDMNQVGRTPVREKAACTGDPEKMSFRVNGSISGLGPDNGGSFAEFEDPAKLDRRLNQLQSDGISVIIVNGFLGRHLFREQMPRVYAQMKKIVDGCHKRGIKVIDHQDLTLLWNRGSAMRNIVSETDHLQHCVGNGGPNTGYCINNPGFRKEFLDRFEREIRNSDLDGLMLDEVSFFNDEICGCSHCRKLFTEATGLTLPMNETLLDPAWRKTSLGRAWSDFRLKCVGDFFAAMRRRAEQVKKEFTLMVYTTHYGWASTYASLTQGCSLAEDVRGCDFVGTEIMSRNVIVAHRAVMAYRKMKNSLNFEYGCPIFGLIYPVSNPDIAYYGWALNYMNGQTTWLGEKIKGDEKFVAFRGGTDRVTQHPAGKVGILFSMKSKDYAVNYAFTAEPLGLSELLTDLRIDHRFLLDESLTEEKLKAFDALIIPGCSNLTDQECETLMKFAENGGKLFLTSQAGCCDALGNSRTEWPFRKMFGFSPVLPVKSLFSGRVRIGDRDVDASEDRYAMLRTETPDADKTNVLWYNPLEKKNPPVLVKSAYGKGEAVWCTARFGALLCEEESTINNPWKYNPDPAFLTEVKAMLKTELGEYSLFDTPELPARVMTSCTQDRKDGKKRLALHLLNGTDSVLKVGENIPTKALDGMWQPLEREVWIRFAKFNARQAVAESPDFAGKRQLELKHENGDTLVRLKPDDLKCFTVIVLTE